jgi:hypothetical protein
MKLAVAIEKEFTAKDWVIDTKGIDERKSGVY